MVPTRSISKFRSPRAGAFSLVELLTVVAVIAIFAAFAVPAFNSITKGFRLSRAADMIASQLNLAREKALSSNRKVTLRFFKLGDESQPGVSAADPSTWLFSAVQLYQNTENNIPLPASRVQPLPVGILLKENDQLSPLLAKTRQQPGDLSIGKYDKNYTYCDLTFLPNGSVDITNGNNWLTVVDGTSPGGSNSTVPANFVCIQVNPVNGNVRAFRP